ncbi:CKLF-like MARVEL transmembrane domain-containing protein 1 [Tenrec ecaudatus]|uniref:CKLF-like MARVEL transmembrane domain-containing protein 1 n=1 Tax=Tenrec ecaudatus TaxID=94439 RepID=UPI003F59105B
MATGEPKHPAFAKGFKPTPSRRREPDPAKSSKSTRFAKRINQDKSTTPLIPPQASEPTRREDAAPGQGQPSPPPAQPPPPQQQSLSPGAKKAIQERAEGRAKVPERFRDSIKKFFFSPTGLLKILRLGLIVGALACFIQVEAHESFIAITVLEICIVTFFILVYMFSLQHLLICLQWPLLDLINSIITSVFLLIVAILAMQEKNRRSLFYIGGTLCLVATIVCAIDAFVVTKKMRETMRSMLQVRSGKGQGAKPTPAPGYPG